MTDKILASSCGLYCGDCEQLGKSCAGCGSVKGRPFWTTHAGVETCPLYDCCVNQRQLEHCGQCDELPCKVFNEFYDPALSPEDAKKSIRSRIDALRKRGQT